MFSKTLTIIILTISLNSLKSWDDYADQNLEELFSTLENPKEIETLKNCQSIKNFMKSLKNNENLILSFREHKNEDIAQKTFFDLKNEFIQKKLKNVITSKKVELENLFINLNALNLENPNIDLDTEIKMEPQNLEKRGSLLKHMNSITEIIPTQPEDRLGKEKRFSPDFQKLGKIFSSLTFIRNYNQEEDFVCYRIDQISLLIFQMVHLRYIKHHEDLRNLLKGFLNAFFVHLEDKLEKKVFFNLFRSFYSFHLHLFLRFDQEFTNQIMFLLANLRDEKNVEMLVDDFINVYLNVIDDLDKFTHENNRRFQKDLENMEKDVKKYSGESLILGIMYGIGKLEALFEFPGLDLIKFMLRNHIGNLHSKLETILRNNLIEKKKEFIDDLKFHINKHNFAVKSVDILNIYNLIKKTEAGKENKVFCDTIDMSEYFVNQDFEEGNLLI